MASSSPYKTGWPSKITDARWKQTGPILGPELCEFNHIMSVHFLKCQSGVEWIETLTIFEAMMVYGIGAMKEDPGEVYVTEVEVKYLASCLLHDIEKDSLAKEVGKSVTEKRNRVRTYLSGQVSVVKGGNKKGQEGCT